jgi:hypothetical protein
MVLEVQCPLLTVSVMFDIPIWPAAGVSVTVRFVPDPEMTIDESGMNAVLLEVPDTVSSWTPDVSATVNAIGAVGPLAASV